MSTPVKGDQNHLEMANLYAIRALPATEITEFEGHLANCPDCRQEIDSLHSTMASLAAWPTDLLRPSTSLWSEISQRVSAESGVEPLTEPNNAAPKLDWQHVAPAISVKVISTDPVRGRLNMLVRLAPGGEYPSHRHADTEQLHLLDGELWIDEKKLVPGDFFEARPGTVDHRVWTETGCTCLLLTSMKDVLL